MSFIEIRALALDHPWGAPRRKGSVAQWISASKSVTSQCLLIILRSVHGYDFCCYKTTSIRSAVQGCVVVVPTGSSRSPRSCLLFPSVSPLSHLVLLLLSSPTSNPRGALSLVCASSPARRAGPQSLPALVLVQHKQKAHLVDEDRQVQNYFLVPHVILLYLPHPSKRSGR